MTLLCACTLAKCPIGLFVSEAGSLCLKTEYGNNDGRIDAYIVSSGEFFWGTHPQTIANQRAQMVRPVTDLELDDFMVGLGLTAWGGSDMRVEPQWFRCACGHQWTGELVQDAPAGVVVAAMKAVHCPQCANDWRRIFLVTKPLVEKPA